MPRAPETNASPPKIEFGVSAPSSVLFPETKSFTPLCIAGKLLGDASAMISVPEIAVADTKDPPAPTDPDIVPINAIFHSLEINITPTAKMRVILGSN